VWLGRDESSVSLQEVAGRMVEFFADEANDGSRLNEILTKTNGQCAFDAKDASTAVFSCGPSAMTAGPAATRQVQLQSQAPALQPQEKIGGMTLDAPAEVKFRHIFPVTVTSQLTGPLQGGFAIRGARAVTLRCSMTKEGEYKACNFDQGQLGKPIYVYLRLGDLSDRLELYETTYGESGQALVKPELIDAKEIKIMHSSEQSPTATFSASIANGKLTIKSIGDYAGDVSYTPMLLTPLAVPGVLPAGIEVPTFLNPVERGFCEETDDKVICKSTIEETLPEDYLNYYSLILRDSDNTATYRMQVAVPGAENACAKEFKANDLAEVGSKLLLTTDVGKPGKIEVVRNPAYPSSAKVTISKKGSDGKLVPVPGFSDLPLDTATPQVVLNNPPDGTYIVDIQPAACVNGHAYTKQVTYENGQPSTPVDKALSHGLRGPKTNQGHARTRPPVKKHGDKCTAPQTGTCIDTTKYTCGAQLVPNKCGSAANIVCCPGTVQEIRYSFNCAKAGTELKPLGNIASATRNAITINVNSNSCQLEYNGKPKQCGGYEMIYYYYASAFDKYCVHYRKLP